ncbi:hypothetical protein QBC37DRAFT_447106 [Rhypophila decipiens]|uniref:Protein kinase domain-containing protein n=1 Tax=Rhypophila decipiens TaxID=261697 RepID=A0AAN7B5H0_9PEZI|nr:hypothetical protein QBC37DRAFT_447106 [Rhypophila decipiens]
MTKLGNEIRRILRKTKNWQGKNYLPQDDLVELITADTVASELGLDTAHPTVQYIVNNAQRLFCIMVLLKSFRGWSIHHAAEKLKEHGVTDNFLPVDYDSQTEKIVSLQGAPRDDVAMKWFLRDVQDPNQNEDYDHHNWACDFTERQWGFLAPIFTKHEAVYPLQDGCPLPFTDYVETGDAGGATSILAKAQVHSEHLKVETTGQWVAIKKINDTDDKLLAKVAQREVAALDLVRRLKHRHLIKFIASYSQQGRHHLIFGWANGGNLKEFWKKTSHTSLGPLRRPQTVRWAIEQMSGLAGALNMLHNPGFNGLNCRHGDLKPANVVIATNLEDDPYGLGLLQITDMGLAKVNDHRTLMRITSGTHSITERYQSPEFRFRISPDTPTSRSFDVWSMGCIMLEFVVWLLYGGNQLDLFNGSFPNTFFHVDEDGNHSVQVELEPSVIEWISHMKETAIGEPAIEKGQCASKALVQVLKLIEEEILVKDEPQTADLGQDDYVTVTGPQANGSDASAPPATNRRITSTELMKALEAILREGGEEGETYFFSGPPSWPPPPSESIQPDPAPAQDQLRPNSLPIHGLEQPRLLRRRSSSFRQGHGDMHPASTQNEYSVEPMSDYWDTYPDNPLALSVFPYIDTADVVPDHLPSPATRPCQLCSNIFNSHFVFDTVQPAVETCCICQTLSAYLARAPPNGIRGNEARFVRRGSYLARHSAGSPVYSIIVGPGISAAPNDLQRSFPKLPDPGSDAEFAILRRWLKDCDDPQRHRCESKPKTASRVDELPTRLVAVGKTGDPHVTVIESEDRWEDNVDGVRLKAPQPDSPAPPRSRKKKPELPNLDFVALSHRWAYPPNKESFKLARPVGISTEEDPYKVLIEVTKTKADGTTTTEKKSVQDTYKKWVTDKRRIPLVDMPQNFQDAITVTRNLGVPYLWIDSLCIIQGDEADWLREAGRMRHVYNGAYCTVATTRAKLTTEGFLHVSRSQSSQCIKVRTVTPSGREADIYLREAIDDFRKDVEQAELNRRGWVFHERALSRRILHFAGPQVYMECGGGICCETTTRLFNRPSFFFSDANFPAQAQSFYKGMKIRFYETVYQEYSARDFSVHSDRAIALEGLESKILETDQSAGAYGIIQLPSSSSTSTPNGRTSGGIHRSLMWQRDGPKMMRRITGDETPEAQKRMSIVPTWSWMKVMGPIRYFDIPMDTVDWSSENALSSPFKKKPVGLMSVQNADELYIRAIVSRLDEVAYKAAVPVTGSMGVGVNNGNNLFVMDCVDSPGHVQGLSCVVIGKNKTGSNVDFWMCYVLLVAPTGRPSDGDDAPCYERVGVGRVEQRYLLPVAENGGQILLV